MQRPIYLDCNATTPVDPRVLDAMLPFLREHFGNASSRTHSFGWVAEEGVNTARARVATLLGVSSREIVFTSGATESIHIALTGVARARRGDGRHIVTTNIEHKALAHTLEALEADGFSVTTVPVGNDGIVAVDDIARAMTPETTLVAVMAANNEIGTLQPLEAIGRLARERGATFFVDAAQAVGKLTLPVSDWNIDLLALSAHKLYGPKGVGALYKSRRVRLDVAMGTGGQERGLRAGTLNVPGIVGLGLACELAAEEMQAESVRLAHLRDALLQGLQQNLDDVIVNGSMQARLPGNLNVAFPGAQGESLLMQLNDIAVSPGAACDSANSEPSHVLRAIGLSDDVARSSIRFGLGRFNTEEEIRYTIDKVVEAVTRLRRASPLYEA